MAACDFSVDFDYIFMLYAFDYPIWANSAISQYLELNKGHEYLWAIAAESTYYLCDLQREIYPDLEIKLFWCQLNRILRAIERKLCKFLRIRKPKRFFCGGAEMVVYKGSDYFCITKSLARFAIEQYSTHKEIAKHFKDTFAPSETVIHTIAFNSQFKDKCILVDPPYKGLQSLTPLHYIDGCNIKVLGLEDYDKLVESGKMFARKFRTGASEALIHRIEDSRK